MVLPALSSSPAGGDGSVGALVHSVTSGAIAAIVPIDTMRGGFARAELRFDGLVPPTTSFEVRVFVNEARANAKTPTINNPRYLGSQFFYGVGVDEDARTNRRQQFAPTQIRLNVTSTLAGYLAHTKHPTVEITLVVVGGDGDEIMHPGLAFESLSLVTT